MVVVKSHLYVVKDAQIFKQTDVLKGSGHSCPVNLNIFLSRNVLSVQKDDSSVRLVHACQKVEYGCLSRSVRADEAVRLALLNCNVKIVYCLQSAEGDT